MWLSVLGVSSEPALLPFLAADQIIITNYQSAAFYRAAHRNWLYLFFPEDYDFSGCVSMCFARSVYSLTD